jgi:hypothetical protein
MMNGISLAMVGALTSLENERERRFLGVAEQAAEMTAEEAELEQVA